MLVQVDHECRIRAQVRLDPGVKRLVRQQHHRRAALRGRDRLRQTRIHLTTRNLRDHRRLVIRRRVTGIIRHRRQRRAPPRKRVDHPALHIPPPRLRHLRRLRHHPILTLRLAAAPVPHKTHREDIPGHHLPILRPIEPLHLVPLLPHPPTAHLHLHLLELSQILLEILLRPPPAAPAAILQPLQRERTVHPVPHRRPRQVQPLKIVMLPTLPADHRRRRQHVIRLEPHPDLVNPPRHHVPLHAVRRRQHTDFRHRRTLLRREQQLLPPTCHTRTQCKNARNQPKNANFSHHGTLLLLAPSILPYPPLGLQAKNASIPDFFFLSKD